MTYGGAAVALVNPFHGLLAYIALAVLRPTQLWAWSLPQDGRFSLIVGAALVVSWAVHGFGEWKFGPARPIVFFLLAYWFWMILSATMAAHQQVAWSYVILHSKILLPVLIGMTIIRSTIQLRQLAWTLVLCLGFIAYEAHGMYYGGGLAQLREQGMLGMDNNSLSIALAAGAGLAVFLGFYESSWWLKLASFGLAGLMVHVPMFGNSRGGMLGILVVGVVTFILLPKRFGMLATYCVGVLVAIRLAGPAVVERFSTVFASAEARDSSAQSRIDLWADCWDVMINNPLLGIGPDHWPLIAEQYGWPPGKEAHSVWFNCGAELGFVGLGLLLLFYFSSLWLAWSKLCRSAEVTTACRDFGRMSIASLCGFVVSASFVSLDALEVPFYVVLISVGTLRIMHTEMETAPDRVNLDSTPNDSAASGFSVDSLSQQPGLQPWRFRLKAPTSNLAQQESTPLNVIN